MNASMDRDGLRRRFSTLTTAHVADACLRAGVQVRCGPAGLQAVIPGSRLAGRVCPTRHVGSVDVFLEALERSEPGDVLVVWGLHRDTADITAIGLPLFSLGTTPGGQQRLDPRLEDALESPTVGAWTVGRDDLVLADDDGVLFLPVERAAELVDIAEAIRDTERRQAERVRDGESLRAQLRFEDYLARRDRDPSLTFREHLRSLGGAMEE